MEVSLPPFHVFLLLGSVTNNNLVGNKTFEASAPWTFINQQNGCGCICLCYCLLELCMLYLLSAMLFHESIHLVLICSWCEPIVCCEVGNWTKHHAIAKEPILGYSICLPFLWLCSQFLSRGLVALLALSCNWEKRSLSHSIISGFWQVKSVVLHTLNRARFTVAVDSFLKTGMA